MTNKTTSADREPCRDRARILCDTAGSILSVRVRGEIDHHTASEIRRGIDAILFEKRPKQLILDLSAVSFMDSSGLGLIMGRYSVMKELEGEMIVWNPSPETRSIMTLAGMERMVRIEYPTVEEVPAAGGAAEESAVKTEAVRTASRRPQAASLSRTARTGSARRRRPSAPSPRAERKERDA